MKGWLGYFTMKQIFILKEKKAQTAVEYLLLLTTVVAIVLIGFKFYLPGFREAADVYYNRVVPGILGEPPDCGDGTCVAPFENCEKCPTDCGACS